MLCKKYINRSYRTVALFLMFEDIVHLKVLGASEVANGTVTVA